MEALGIDVRLLIAQVVNLSVLLVVLRKVIYKPLIKLLDDRKLKIEEALENSKKIENRLAEIDLKEKEIFKEAQKKAQKETSDLIELAHEEKRRIIEEAKILAEKETQKGIDRIKMAEVEAQQRLKNQFTQAVIKEISEKIYSKNSKNGYPMLEGLIK